MSLLKVNTIRNRVGTGSPEFDKGINVSTGISTISGVKINAGIITSSSLSGVVTYYGDGGGLFGIPNASLENFTISGKSLGSNLSNLTPGNYITGSCYNGSTARTFAVDATSSNTANKVVARDSNGDFSGRYITATQFKKTSGTSTQFLKADGSVDSNTYMTSSSATSSNTAYSIVSRGSSGGFSAGEIIVNSLTSSGIVTASGFVVSSQSGFLKANGTIDNSTYLTTASIGDGTLTVDVSGNGLLISTNPNFKANQSTNKTITVSSNATSANLADTIVFRDSNGNFTANVITSTNFNSTSDIKLKKEINLIQNSLSKVQEMRGVSFIWKDTESPSIGVIAQEIENIFPELVEQNDNVKTVNYNGLIAVLIESVKELKKEIDDLKKINNKIEE